MRAFERVSRTIQRLCNGYTSLPGLLEWGRITAARLESTTAAGRGHGLGGEFDITDNIARNSLHASCGSGGIGTRDEGDVASTRAATATVPTAGGGGNHDRLMDSVRGPGGQQLGSAGSHRTSSSVYLGGAGSGSTEYRFGDGVCASSVVTAPYSSAGSCPASTSSLPGWISNPISPSRDTFAAQGKSHYLPKKAVRAGGRYGVEGTLGVARKGVRMAGHTSVGGISNRGVLCAAEFGGGGSDLSSLGSHRRGGGGDADDFSSVASLLREDRAFKQRSGVYHG